MMRIPIWSNIHDLSAPPRRFLLFSIFNVLSWQCIVGPVLVLFARHIEMPATWVGFINSFLPFSMLLVAFTVPLVTHFGSKRVMSCGWLLRNIVACSVFLMPWVLAGGRVRAGWLVLAGATLGFCVMRAMGVGGWFPWLHEVVPEDERGRYFGAEATTTHVMNILVMTGQGLILRATSGLSQFLAIYAIGIGAGLISILWMTRIPGGRGQGEQLELKRTVSLYGPVLSDKRFVHFVLMAALCFSAVSWISASVVLFMRDAMLLSSRTIMFITALNSVWILMTVARWGRYADHSGSGRAMFKTLLAHSIVALALLFVLPGSPWGLPLLILLCGLISIFGAGFWASVHRAMLNFVEETHRVAYGNLWIVVTALAMGLTPILAGMFIDWWGLWGYRTCFILASVTGLCCAALSEWVVADGPRENATLRERLLNPAMPIRTLARIVWITAGLHESNRPEASPTSEG